MLGAEQTAPGPRSDTPPLLNHLPSSLPTELSTVPAGRGIHPKGQVRSAELAERANLEVRGDKTPNWHSKSRDLARFLVCNGDGVVPPSRGGRGARVSPGELGASKRAWPKADLLPATICRRSGSILGGEKMSQKDPRIHG